MRSSRSLLSFALGAITMLAVAVAMDGTAHGLVGRVRAAFHPHAPVPGAAPAGVPAAPAPTAPVAAATPGPADSSLEVPVAGAGPVDLPTGEPPAPPAAAVPGDTRLLIPVQGVKAGSLVDTYEQARGSGRRHDAIDIMAPRGTPVVAVADGVVMKLFQSARGGTTLYELAPDRRTIYYYAHLYRYAPGIAEGQAVRRGQLLGYVGNTGDAGPGNYHLHFEVSTTTDPARYWGGTPQNPYPLLR